MPRSERHPLHYWIGQLNGVRVYWHPLAGFGIEQHGDYLAAIPKYNRGEIEWRAPHELAEIVAEPAAVKLLKSIPTDLLAEVAKEVARAGQARGAGGHAADV